VTGSGERSKPSETIVAKPADWFQNGFHRFLETYLKRHFHAIAIETNSIPRPGTFDQDRSLPMVVYCNHPSWWDPLLAHYMNQRLFKPRQFYAPIDASALQKYKVFEKLGFFGVDLQSTRGAASFLKTTAEIFRRPESALWLTPEGRFADVRDHDAELMPGLSHLCSRLDRGIVVPMSLEYVFWEERLPECLIRFGDWVSIEKSGRKSKSEWSDELATRLRDNQARLAELVIARSADPFTNLLRGQQGARGMYDWSRRIKIWFPGGNFQAAHGEKFVE
jgi:1-acyl-sn-glycerol-3-phosphate acyltransferase